MTFHFRGLSTEPFRSYFGLGESELLSHGIRRYMVDERPGFPDRVTLTDLPVGETVLLINFEHLPVNSPYRSRHAIFVGESDAQPFDETARVPDVIRPRMISLRAFDKDDMIVDADLVEGRDIEPLMERYFANSAVSYLHAHFAKRGCFAARIDRAY